MLNLKEKAQFVAKVVNSGFYDYFDKCYEKNNHFYFYDCEDLRIKPISIKELASHYEEVIEDTKEVDYDF